MAEELVGGLAVLCDADIAITEDPRRLEVSPHAVGGKVVDAPVPPLEVLLEVFAAAGVTPPPEVLLPWGPGDHTLAGNSNGGLYLVPGDILSTVASSWAHWARWLLDRMELLRTWTVYVDQVAMALGLAAAGIEPTALDVRWNTPTHDLTRIPTEAPAPAIVHYHQQVDNDGRLLPTGNAAVDRTIAVVNAAIADRWPNGFPQLTVREWRRRQGLGRSGHSTPRDIRTVLSSLVEALRPSTVLEVGCAEPELTSAIPSDRYVGIDPSPDVIQHARTARPDGEFLIGTLHEHEVEADLTICTDTLSRLSNASHYESLVSALWTATHRVLLVTGLEVPVDAGTTGQWFHEPLSTTLRRIAPEAELYPLEDDGALTTFAMVRPTTVRHPRDFDATTLAALVDRHPDPGELLAIRLHARQTVGFYPDHAPRLWEYPMVARLMLEHLPPGSRIVDIGAGTTPLAPYLTMKGFVVDTVDPSPVRRTWPPAPDWNEWDFLDYGKAGLARRSWNCMLADLPARPNFDGAYSVGVIEHISAEARRSLLSDISDRVRTGGLVVLTIDLVRDSDVLWNRNLGVEVEDPRAHGTVQDVIREAKEAGLELMGQETVRSWGDTDVDIGLLVMTQCVHRPPKRRIVNRHRVASAVRRLRP